jgi:hypothetical protein
MTTLPRPTFWDVSSFRDDEPCRYSPRCRVHPAFGRPGRQSLTEADVAVIHAMLAGGDRPWEVAEYFGLTSADINAVKTGRIRIRGTNAKG